jgi:hypothetical protein
VRTKSHLISFASKANQHRLGSIPGDQGRATLARRGPERAATRPQSSASAPVMPSRASLPARPSGLLALRPAAQSLRPKAGPGSGSNAGPGKVLPGVRVGWSSRPGSSPFFLFFFLLLFFLPLSSLSIWTTKLVH